MRRFFSRLLVLSLIVFASVSAFATDEPEIVVSDSSGTPAQEVEVSISLKGNPGIASMKLTVLFDGAALDALSAKLGEAFMNTPNAQHLESLSSGKVTLNWLCITSENTADDVYAVLRFRIREDASNGNYPIQVIYDRLDVFNQALDPIPFTVRDGTVTVNGRRDQESEGSPDPHDLLRPDDADSKTEYPGAQGQESARIPFADVNQSDWFYNDVLAMYDAGYIHGVSDTSFQPQGVMNRAMVVQVLYSIEVNPESSMTQNFPDVTEGAWYYEPVSWAARNGIVMGFDDGRFYPLNDVSREQFAAMLYRYAQSKGVSAGAATDLASNEDVAQVSAWAQQSMSWAVGAGIIHGRQETQLSPGETVTRAEAVVMLHRLLLSIENQNNNGFEE